MANQLTSLSITAFLGDGSKEGMTSGRSPTHNKFSYHRAWSLGYWVCSMFPWATSKPLKISISYVVVYQQVKQILCRL